jgi:hypothetical protein
MQESAMPLGYTHRNKKHAYLTTIWESSELQVTHQALLLPRRWEIMRQEITQQAEKSKQEKMNIQHLGTWGEEKEQEGSKIRNDVILSHHLVACFYDSKVQ